MYSEQGRYVINIYIYTWTPTWYTRKLVRITGRASLFLENFSFLKLQSQSKLNPNQNPNQIYSFFFALLSSSVSWANLSCAIATIFSSLAFLSSSISLAYLGHLVAASFSSLALLSSSVSTANLICISKWTSFFVHTKAALAYSRNE